MVNIPISPGVRSRPTTQVSDAAPIGEQIIPRAISGAVTSVAQIALQKRAEAQREQNVFDASQMLDVKTKLRRFDNQQKIRLAELPANEEVINNEKNRILEERQGFIEELSGGFEDNDKLRKLVGQQASTSSVDLEFALDRDLSNKKQEFGRNRIFESISDLKTQSETAATGIEFAQINNDLSEILQVGLGSGLINQKDIERQEKIFKELRKERQQELQNQQTFSDVIAGAVLLDSTNKSDRSLINDSFNKLATQVEDPEQLAEQISIKTGIIPSTAKQSWSSKLFAGSPNQKIQASETIEALIKENPNLERQFNPQEKALSKAINDRQALGLPADQVIEFAQEEIKQNKSQERVVREGQFNLQFGKSETSKKAVEQIQDLNEEFQDESGFFFEGELPQQMGLDTRRLAKDFFLNEGVDMETALKLAKDKVKGEWFLTNIGKKRYQKFAPERFYAVEGVNNKWIENQALQQIRKTTTEDISTRELKGQTTLEVIPDTIMTGQPSYNIYRENEFGATELVLDNQNLPMVFTPDFTKTEEYKRDQERRDDLRLTPEKKESFKEFQERRFKQRQKEKELQKISVGGKFR
jgi:hypothetical protein